MFKASHWLIILLAALLLLAACQSAVPQPSTSPTPEGAAAYPPPRQPVVAGPYPAPPVVENLPYPPPRTDEIDPNAVPFQLDKPLVEGATQISGSGPAGVPIAIFNVTLMREYIAETRIGADGRFSVQVPALTKGYRIGLALGALDGTEWTEESFQNKGYFGVEARTIPMVGFFYDTAQVKGK
jgi:hypothetical protein